MHSGEQDFDSAPPPESQAAHFDRAVAKNLDRQFGLAERQRRAETYGTATMVKPARSWANRRGRVTSASEHRLLWALADFVALKRWAPAWCAAHGRERVRRPAPVRVHRSRSRSTTRC